MDLYGSKIDRTLQFPLQKRKSFHFKTIQFHQRFQNLNLCTCCNLPKLLKMAQKSLRQLSDKFLIK